MVDQACQCLQDPLVIRVGTTDALHRGFAFVKACHSKGARVVVGDLKMTSEADEYVSKASESEIVFQKCDVSNWDELHNLISVSIEKFGEVRLLITQLSRLPCWTVETDLVVGVSHEGLTTKCGISILTSMPWLLALTYMPRLVSCHRSKTVGRAAC